MTSRNRLLLESTLISTASALLAYAALSTVHANLPNLQSFDLTLQAIIHSWTTPALTLLFRTFTIIGSIAFFIPILILSLVILLLLGEKEKGVRLTRKRHTTTLFVHAIGGALILNQWFKMDFHRARPQVPWSIGDEHTFSFPSGHSLFSFALYGLIAYTVLGRRDPLPRRSAVAAAAALMVLGIGVSRIYLGMHWPTDVLAGYLTAAIWLSSTIAIDRRWRKAIVRCRTLSG